MAGISLLFQAVSQTQPLGNLVIVGGGLEDGNKSIYDQFIGFAGGAGQGTFAIIPSASGAPVQSYVSFRNILISYGVHPEHIHLINIALMDDDSTATVDESEWKDNGDDPALAGLVGQCSAVWFSGGDQSRTVKTLVRPDGSNSRVLEAVWEVYRSGGVVGGTSAGAAIMSETMIGGGNSLAALTRGVITDYQGNDFPDGGGVLLLKGLGFFPNGIIDQHFGARARFGRLVVALMDETYGHIHGFGIDENTALIYSSSKNLINVAGTGGVTIINRADATISYVQGLPNIENLSVSYLEEGDVYDCTTGMITPADGKKPTRGNEYHNIPNPGQAGILSGYSETFRDLLTINLMDNKGSDSVRNITFYDDRSGFQVTLSKNPESVGFYAEQPYGTERYTVANVRLDIAPVRVSIMPLKN
ncbi:MAG TPA: cyanophycinase [Bacteroidales bacterium]|nr:cyanophycinase [Bacteroidales bacterium]HNS46389.1 cyanophycinase [Bacteroidales bacterium]